MTLLTELITDLSPSFDAWEYEKQAKNPSPPNKKQKRGELSGDSETEKDLPPPSTAGGSVGVTEPKENEKSFFGSNLDAEFGAHIKSLNEEAPAQQQHHHQEHPELQKVVGASLSTSAWYGGRPCHALFPL